MKRALLCLSTTFFLSGLTAQVVFETNFSADAVATNLSGQSGWSNNSSNAAGFPGAGDCAGIGCARAQVVATALTSPISGYFGGSVAKSVAFAPSQDAVGHYLRGRGNVLPDTAAFANYPDGTTIYASFLLRLSDAPNSTTGGQLVRFMDNGFTVGMRLYAQKNAAGAVRFGIEKNGGAAYGAYNYALNTTYLVVMKHEIVAGALNDRVSLYVNPTGSTEPASPVATATAGDDITIQRMLLYLNQASSPTGNIGGIRVTRSWASLGISGSSTREPNGADFSVKPTLANDFLTVETKNNALAATLKIVDLSGRVVCVDKLTANETQKTINISYLSSGLYVAQLVTENGVAIQKFTKE